MLTLMIHSLSGGRRKRIVLWYIVPISVSLRKVNALLQFSFNFGNVWKENYIYWITFTFIAKLKETKNASLWKARLSNKLELLLLLMPAMKRMVQLLFAFTQETDFPLFCDKQINKQINIFFLKKGPLGFR